MHALALMRRVRNMNHYECRVSSTPHGRRSSAVLFLHWDGVDLLRVGRFGEVESLIRHPGQGVLHVVALPIGRWQADLEAHAEAVDIEKLRENDRRRGQRSRTNVRSASG